MGKYRAFCFDGKGRVWVEDHLAATTDDQAIQAALAISSAVKLEIRDEKRVVKVIER